MSAKLYFINGNWITYEEAHNLGYSLYPQHLVDFYTANNIKVSVKQDSSDNTYYDSTSNIWVTDFADLGLYKKMSSLNYYRGETLSTYSCYLSSIYDSSSTYVLYDSSIISLNDAYEHYGITSYKCDNVIVYGNNIPVVWYDSITNKFFDDRDDYHRWVTDLDGVKVTSYNSSTNFSKDIYESDDRDDFYIDGEFISRDNFYANSSNGIIREYTFTFYNDTIFSTYYDSYSNKYCIPNITQIWVSKQDLLNLGYTFVDGTADLWLCQDKLHLAWNINIL